MHVCLVQVLLSNLDRVRRDRVAQSREFFIHDCDLIGRRCHVRHKRDPVLAPTVQRRPRETTHAADA